MYMTLNFITVPVHACMCVICGCRAIQTNVCGDITGTAGYVAIVTVQARPQYSLNALSH